MSVRFKISASSSILKWVDKVRSDQEMIKVINGEILVNGKEDSLWHGGCKERTK